MTLKNLVVLITGASSGIGKQCAIDVSNAGANVILFGRNRDRLDEVYKNLSPGNHLAFQVDITDYDKIEPLIEEIVDKVGKISGFVSCAGVESTLPIQALKPNVYKELFSINVIAGFEIARIISKKKFFKTEGASFVFLSSIMSVLGAKGKIAYCSSKSALLAGVKAMALELAPKKIRVNCVSPAIVETEMTQKMFKELPEDSKSELLAKHLLGFGKPSDISNLVKFLLSDQSRWITGTNLIIDGGYSCH
ncbi:MAG: SDR family oxidoreductase [Acholeplasmataceae bacterium]|jgi:NAD(P)-dependent dehydrogenase (short-subunit alcohol dehydrogenase family)|nr:SDR family oxidoreductase [Acholeplasmataceae bacterium]